MLTILQAVVATAASVLLGVGFAQVKADQAVNILPCTDTPRISRRIVSNLQIVEFYIPRFATVKKAGDVDYVEYYVRYGPKQDKMWLKFMFGPLVGGQSPDDLANTSIRWTVQKLGCHRDVVGADWRGIGTDDRKWRHIAIPLGFATYKNAPPKAADYFDKILDTLCCGNGSHSEK